VDYKIINTSDQLWTQTLNQLKYDFYHLPGYLNLEASRLNATPKAIIIQDGDRLFFLPYLLRSWNNSLNEKQGWDVVSPYGYCGFLVNESTNRSEFIRQAIGQLQQIWQSYGICSAFLRLHPILNSGVEHVLSDHPALQIDGGTVSVDLSPSLDDLWKQTRSDHRQRIRYLKKAGFSIEIVSSESNLDSFISIYNETMDRVCAKPFYYFSRDYFIELIHALDSRLHLFMVRSNETIAAAAFVTEYNGIVQYYLSGSSNSFLKESPTRLVLDYVRTWAKERGNYILHLGGGLGASQDSLYDFKAGFANQAHSFSTLRMILDEAQYSSWLALKAQEIHQTREKLLCSNYFPAYRAIETDNVKNGKIF
jgi:Acetyltransferase (GNAT) domain